MLAVVVPRPRKNRTIWREAALSGFIARRTWGLVGIGEAGGAGGGADAGLIEEEEQRFGLAAGEDDFACGRAEEGAAVAPGGLGHTPFSDEPNA